MPITNDETGRAGNAADLNTSLTVDAYTANTKQKIDVTQAKSDPKRVIEAKRELLRDYAHEAATQAADHASMLARYIELDDLPGLKYSASKFVAYAREAAKASRELIGGVSA
jgi:hypothetical protein